MLVHLSVKDLAIIESLEVEFGPGLNILTGETGAGKSIILGAVQLLMGARAQTDLVRRGAEEASVVGLIELDGSAALSRLLNDYGLEDGGELILKRVVSSSGRSRAYVNNTLVNLSTLAELGGRILSISGQHEAQRLLRPEEHLLLLDAYGGLEQDRAAVAQAHSRFRGLEARLKELETAESGKQERIELLSFQLEEIEKAALLANEEEELRAERERLRHAERLSQGAGQAYQVLYGEDGSVVEALGSVKSELEKLARLDPGLGPILERIAESAYVLEDAGRELMSYADRVVFDPRRQNEVEARLTLISRLAAKHAPGQGSEAVLDQAEAMAQELDRLKGMDLEMGRLREEAARAGEELLSRADQLHAKREAAAQRLARAVAGELEALSLAGSRFEAALEEKPPGPDGRDRVTFLLSTNPGEDPRPLAKVASGGELSRITLALKSILARQGSVETVVFDEVDAGIGGGVAEVVGAKLRSLGQRQQILCITHLPQIAVFGQSHYLVAKSVVDQRTVSFISRLDQDRRIRELARMLGGSEISEMALAHAREMLAGAA